MKGITKIARQDILRISPYIPGEYEKGFIRLNANESPWKAPGDKTENGLNRYPPPRPTAINNLLSVEYQIKNEQIMITRGASEAIDILIRAFCEPKRDKILICPPTFDMYRLYAEIQGAYITKVPLLRNKDLSRDFSLDVENILKGCDKFTKIIFICTPNNPTGNSPNAKDIELIAEQQMNKSIIVIDEAYQEFSDSRSFIKLQKKFNNIVVLRTLSKFVSLAGVRCGSVIEEVKKALTKKSILSSRKKVEITRKEKKRFTDKLLKLPEIQNIWPSDANFFMAEVKNLEKIVTSARSQKILVRAFPNEPLLKNCLRITVGKKEENDALVQSIIDGG